MAAGARALALVVGAAGIVGFVLLARPEPSVLRAAAMGTVALVGMGANGRDRGIRAPRRRDRGAAPRRPGARRRRRVRAVGARDRRDPAAGARLADALARWLPRWLAEAVAVPAAAQLACTPLVAAISGQVSLVAVARQPARRTGGRTGHRAGPARRAGRRCVAPPLVGWWARLPAGAWPGSCWSPVAAPGCPRRPSAGGPARWRWSCSPRLSRWRCSARAWSAAAPPAWPAARCSSSRAGPGRRPPGWPPTGWLMVACDVGQGDGLVLDTGEPHTAVVVDAGPDPRLIDGCLDGLGVTRVPLVVLTHFHADHVDGLPGVLAGRAVDEIDVTRLADPPAGSRWSGAAAGRGLTPRVAPYAVARRVGDLTLEPVWPPPTRRPSGRATAAPPTTPASSSSPGSTASRSSSAATSSRRARPLWPGAARAPRRRAQGAAPRQPLPGPAVPESLRARLAVISVGADNDYGHPAPDTVSALGPPARGCCAPTPTAASRGRATAG